MIPFNNIKKIYLVALMSSLSTTLTFAYFPTNMQMPNQACPCSNKGPFDQGMGLTPYNSGMMNNNGMYGNNMMGSSANGQLGLNYGIGFGTNTPGMGMNQNNPGMGFNAGMMMSGGIGGNMTPNNRVAKTAIIKKSDTNLTDANGIFNLSEQATDSPSDEAKAKAEEKSDTVKETVETKQDISIRSEKTPPYDSLVQEDQQLKAMLDQNQWFLNSKFDHLKTAETLAFKRGYLTSLMNIATNYNVWYSPRQEYLELETDPLVTEAMLVLEFTDSSILVYVAETLLSTMKNSKLLSPTMSDKFAFEDERIKSSRWYNKSQSDVQSNLQKSWDEYTSSITQLEQNKISDDQKLEKAIQNLHRRRQITSLIKYNTKVDNAFITTLKADLESKISTAIASKDTEATEELLKLYSLLITNIRPVIAGASPTEASDPKPIFESAKAYLRTTITQLETAYPIKDYPKMKSVRGDIKFISRFVEVMINPTTTPQDDSDQTPTQVLDKTKKRGKGKSKKRASFTDLLNINILNTKSKIAMKNDQSITATQVQFVRTIPLTDDAQKKIDTAQNKANDLKNQGVTKESAQATVQAKADAVTAKVDTAKTNASTQASTAPANSGTPSSTAASSSTPTTTTASTTPSS